MAETREYISKPETVRATLWNKSGDHKAVIYTPDGEYVLYCDFNAVVRPGYWIVEHADGRIEALSGDLFYALYSTPAPASPPRGAAEGDGDDPYGIADALGVLSRRVEGASDIAIVDVTTSDRGGEGTLSARELRDVVAAASTATRAMQAYHRQSHEIEQILGKALGYPWFRDDPKNFPDATEADGVCVGDHVAESLADEAADRIRDLQSRLAAAEARPDLNVTIGERDVATTIEVPDGVPADVADELAGAFAELMGGRVVGVTRDGEAEAPTLRSQVMALAALKDGWYDGEGTAYRPKQLAAVAGLLERLAGIATASVHPNPDGRVYVEWVDRPRSDSLEIDPATLRCEWHLCNVDTDEVILGEIMPESLAEARPRVGEAWIPAVERLPELAARSGWCADVLVFNGHVVGAAVYCYESATAERLNGLRDFRLPNSMTIIAGVTHWMPFPPPPPSEAADATPV